MMSVRFLAWASVVLLLASAASAQDVRLRGITGVQLIVEEVREDGLKCGLTEDALLTTVQKAVADGNVSIAERSPTALHVSVNTLHLEATPRLCVSYIELRLMTIATASVPYAMDSQQVTVLLMEKARLASCPVAYHAAQVGAVVKGQAEDIITSIRAANKESQPHTDAAIRPAVYPVR